IASMRLRGMAQDATGADGRFALRGLADGGYRLRAARSGEGVSAAFSRASVAAKVGDQNVKLVIENDGKIKGNVLFADGSAPDAFRITTGFGADSSFGGAGGTFVVDAAAGPVTLVVSGPALVQKIVPNLVVKPDETTDAGTITVDRG